MPLIGPEVMDGRKLEKAKKEVENYIMKLMLEEI